MGIIDKNILSERDICTKYITPAIYQSEWDIHTQVREEVTFTKGQAVVQSIKVSREARLAQAQTKGGKLMEAVVYHVLSGDVEIPEGA